MVWMAITHALRRGRPNERRELIVEQNFMGGCLLVDCFSKPVGSSLIFSENCEAKFLEKVMRLGGGLVYMLAFLPLAETPST